MLHSRVWVLSHKQWEDVEVFKSDILKYFKEIN